MTETTLCYLTVNGKVLLLHRIRKKNDPNEGKWIGIGGKFEENEAPEDCALREFREETGLTLTEWRYRGIVTFVSDRWEGEHMHLFTATAAEGTLTRDCDEGVLQWVPVEQAGTLPTWEGDRVFLELLAREEPFFSLRLSYRGDTLTEARLNGTAVDPRRKEEN